MRRSEGGRTVNRPLVSHIQSCLVGGGVHRLPPPGSAALRCHEILMVEEAKEGRGEEAGSDPPCEEGEEAPEKHWAEDSPQAAEGHRQLGH